MNTLTKQQIQNAYTVAIVADAVQIVLAPIFIEGVLSPVNDVLDIVACALLTRTIGWHWLFLPTLGAESLPGLDEAPTWTAAVWFVTRDRQVLPEGQITHIDV